MHRLLIVCLLLTATLVTSVTGNTPQREIDYVAAFARLYGVLRYFYPSDAAASLDWNRFAVYGVQKARVSPDAQAVAMALNALAGPLGPGIIIARTLPPAPPAGAPDASLVAWRYVGAGISQAGPQSAYKAKRTNRSLVTTAALDGFATVMQTVPALPLRGKTIRFRGMVRAEPSSADATTGAALWLRVDRPEQQMGFFDNMGNRPIRATEWRSYQIEGTVADDATSVAFGAMAAGSLTAEFDAIGLDVRDGTGPWTPVDIKDPGFEDSVESAGGWVRAGTSKTAVVSRPNEKAPQGRQFLRIASPPPTASNAELFEAPPPTVGAHVDIDLGLGLRARVPLALSEDAAKSGDRETLRQMIDAVAAVADQPDVDARLSDVVVAWNVFRHFYPYFEEAKVDWNARLSPQLALAYDATTRDAQRDALRVLVADLGDGHGGVVDVQRGGGGQPSLPVRLQVVDGRVAITASGLPEAAVGSVLVSIAGQPADRRLADLVRLTSGSPQWKERRSLQEMTTCQLGSPVALVVDAGIGPRTVEAPCGGRAPVAEKRPAPVGELGASVWYVDLTRATMSQITPSLPQISTAAGVVFDLRGYPTDAGFQILPYLLTAAETDRWMHVNRIVGPYGQSAGWQDIGWDQTPASPHVNGRVVFLTDGSAISYAESVMGYVADRKLGTIVGSTTAGANGNVAVFNVPTGFRVSFTGMRVTGHDGKTPHHLAGVKPDVPVTPTLASLRAGRDEVLERGVAIARGQ